MPDTPRLSTAAKIGLAAAALGAAALFNRQQTRQAEAETPPAGKFVEVDGVRLHYVEKGDGPVLVLIHGMGALVQDFLGSGLVERLSAGNRVLAFDRPGYGYSERPGSGWTPEKQAGLLRAALDTLGVKRPVLVGHSWGTLVALAYALDHPDEVAGLALLSGYYFPTARPDPLLLSGPAIPYAGAVVANTVSPLVARATKPAVFRKIFAPDPVPEGFEQLFPSRLAMRPGQLRAASGDAAQLQLAAIRLSKRYRELTLPIAIAAGTGDKIVAFDQAERLHAALPHSSLHVGEDAGHMIHWVRPDVAVAAIEAASAGRVG